MRSIAIFTKVARELRRDRLVVLLTLAFAPFFVVVYHLAFAGPAGTTYQVALLDGDRPVTLASGRTLDAGADLVAALTGAGPDALSGADVGGGSSPLRVRTVTGLDEGTKLVRDHTVAALIVVPADFSARIAARDQVVLHVHGDVTQPGYLVAGVLADARVKAYVAGATGRAEPVRVVEEPMGSSGSANAFDGAVGGLLVFSVIMLVFLTAMTVARETEQGAMRRLRLAPMPAHSYVLGTSAVLLVVAVGGVLLTFATAAAFGFHSRGPLWVAAVVTTATALSVVGIGMVVGAACRTVAQAFVVANFPLGLLMFLSGAMFPVPRPVVLTVAGHGLGPLDLIPATHAVLALNQVLTLGAGLADIRFELVALVVLSAAYFAVGAGVLRRTRLGRA